MTAGAEYFLVLFILAILWVVGEALHQHALRRRKRRNHQHPTERQQPPWEQ